MEATQLQSKERNKIKELNISIVSSKLSADFITNSYYEIKINNKYLLLLNLKQNNELYIYNINNLSIFVFLNLKESINYFDFHKNYETIFCVATGNDILIYNINIENKMINEISKLQGHFSKVIYTEFSPYDPFVLVSMCDNNDIKIFEVNKTMPKNHIFYEQALDTKIKWTKNKIGVLSKDRKTILISSQNNFIKDDIWEKKFEEKIKDFHFYYDTNEEYIIVLTKKSVIFVEKEKEDKLIYQVNDDVDINYSFYLRTKKILIIFVDKVLIGFTLNYNNIKNISKKIVDKVHYPLFFYDEKAFENNEICKFFNIEDEHINLFSLNLNGYDIKEINNKILDIKPVTEFLNNIVKNIYDIGYLISKKNNNEKDDKYIRNKKYFSYNEIEVELNKVKELDLFKRKNKVSEALKNKRKDKDKEIIDEIDLIVNLKEKYIFILKLLVNDNTNKKLIKKYLDFIKNNKDELNEIYDGNFENFDDEVKYYLNIFNKEEAKIFGEVKKNEKEKLFDLFDDLLEFKEDNIDEFESYLNKFNYTEKNIIYYNIPIDFENEELLFNKYNKLIINFLIEIKQKINKKIVYSNLKNEDEKIKYKKKLLKDELTIIKQKIALTKDYIKDNPKENLIIRLLINLTVKSCDIYEYEFNYNLLTSKEIEKEDDVIKFEKKTQIDIDSKFKNNNKYKKLCLINIEKFNGKKGYSDIKYNFDYYLNQHKNEYHFESVKNFYKNILPNECFKSLYLSLFGGNYYPFSDQDFTNKFIDKYFNFIPMKSQNFSGLTEKLTMITDILTFLPEAKCKEYIEEKILRQGLIILNGNHEFGHNFANINFYNENSRKNTLDINEGGTYLDYALYGRVLKFINLKQAVYIMNQDNYDKNYIEFQKGFNNIQNKDLELKGEFAKVFENINFEEIVSKDNKNIYLPTKSFQDEEIKIDCIIKHDVVGRIIPEDMYEKIYQNQNEFN